MCGDAATAGDVNTEDRSPSVPGQEARDCLATGVEAVLDTRVPVVERKVRPPSCNSNKVVVGMGRLPKLS